MTSLKQLKTMDDVETFNVEETTMMFGCNPTVVKHQSEDRNIYIISKDIVDANSGEKIMLFMDGDILYTKLVKKYESESKNVAKKEVDENNNGNS